MTWIKIPPSEWLDNKSKIESAFNYLHSQKYLGIAYDTETTGVVTFKDRPLLASFSDGVRRFACEADWLEYPIVRDLIEGDCIKIGSNLKFDFHMSANIGIHVGGPMHDTLVMDFLLDENRKGRHGLKEVALEYCGIKMREFTEVFPMNKKKKGEPVDTAGDAIIRKMSTPEGKADAIEYSGLDAYANHLAYQYIKDKLQNIQISPGITLWDFFEQIEAPFTRVLYTLERRGFTICSGYFRQLEGPLIKAIAESEAKFDQAAGKHINLNSPPQLRDFFYTTLGKAPFKLTSGGTTGNKVPSTDTTVLETWADEGDIYAKMILNHRSIAKTYNTYVIGMQELLDSNFRLHTNLNQHIAVTGRLTSNEPNLQNIPSPAKDKFKLRDGFIAPPGKVLIVADYEQLEMVLMAHKSNDPIMIDAIINGKDLHCLAVSLIFGYSYEDVIEAKKAEKRGQTLSALQHKFLELRQAMKAVGYGIIYGIGPFKLAQGLTDEFQNTDKTRVVTEDEAKGYIKAWFSLFKVVEQFIEVQRQYVRQNLYVQTFLGRFRRLPHIKSSKFGDKLKAERQAVNIIQGDAADILRIAMIVLHNHPELLQMFCEMLLQVHDELIFEVVDDGKIIQESKSTIKYEMETSFDRKISKLKVPLRVSINHGYSWAAAK